MIETLLIDIDELYRLTEERDSARSFKASGLKFNARAYSAKGFGHVGVMTGSGMLGLVRLETLILNPFFVDAPIISYDRIHAIGREILVAEMYDSLLGSSFSTTKLENIAGTCSNVPKDKEYWYDSLLIQPRLNLKGRKKDSTHFDDIGRSFVGEYLAAARMAGSCDPAEKGRKAAAYSEGLLSNGGPATDPVKKAMGEEWTADLFRRTLFGIGIVCGKK